MAESATLDANVNADAGPNCAAAGDPTLGVDAGGSSCTGALAQATFTYGLCACTTLQASNNLTTDGFDSTKGAPDGGLGGNVGANTGVSWSTASSIGGNLWTPGNVTSSNPSVVRGDLHIGGTLGGGATFTVDGNAFDVNTLPGNAKVLGKVSKVSSVAAPCDCSNLVPVASITAAHRTTNNDDGTIGLSPTVAVGNNPARLDLPCGNYYLSQINAAQPLTIAVHGHTALYVDGNLNANGNLAIQMDATATLDLFVEGTFNASNGLTLGSVSDPAHCRAYVAGATFNVSGSSTIGCNVYAPEAQVNLANGSTTFGSIFGKSIQANGNAIVHHDTSIASAGGECCSAGTCDDGNPCTVDACNGDGTCSHTAAANGATCTGTNRCDQAYSCQAGACVGSSPVTCAASDACHVAGTCDPTSGACSNPAASNGTTCNDGNACTQSDTCQSGGCMGSDTITCAAEDTCHVAGTCNPGTGACSNPAAANGTTCSDGNACTQVDTCQSGACTGSNPVTCTAGDACHAGGNCDPASGVCSSPPLPNGTPCSDGNACTQSDSCQSGLCTGSSLVVCAASDACHTAGTCNPSTGTCSNPTAANGTPCSDGNACTQTDSCQNGTCAGSNQVTCSAADACHVEGTCSPSTGTCSNPTAANGTTCNDGNACTQNDSCQSGVCTGSNLVTCTAADACHVVGTCSPSTGTCSNPTAANDTTCNDGNPCTLSDVCTGGVCAGTPGACDAGASDGGTSGTDGRAADSGADASDSGPPGQPPQWPATSVLTAAPTGPASTKLAWSAATDPVGVTGYQLFENGNRITTVSGTTQNYFVNELTTGQTYTFAVQAENATGALSNNGPMTTLVAQVPILSVAAAPPLDPTVASSVTSIASFLYSGPNPIQLGLQTAISSQRVVVVQGRVLNSLGNPLAGAAVTVADHPEYGYTVSRSDGHYDLVVNGGGTVTLSFDMAGLLHAERSLLATWGRFYPVPDVALIALDPAVTRLDLSGGAAAQVARASEVADERGARQVTAMFPTGTTAEMTLPSGGVEPLAIAHLRMTEFTVSTNGPAQMPAQLPATSAYTYASAFTIDEVDAVQATQVTFSTPVAVYLENFLSFVVGAHVPSGYYDTAKHIWVASVDGRVVQILSITAGVATLDVDGAGAPATSEELATLGISSDELVSLSALYSTGQTLWRVPVQHFTYWDFNGGSVPPAGACAPSPTCGGGGGPPPPPPPPGGDCDHQSSGCIIDIEAQVLGDQVAVGGTPFSLHYRSDRTSGYRDLFTQQIPLTGQTLPANIQAVQLSVGISGQHMNQTLPAVPNQTFTYTWNGQDGYGRPVNGQQQVFVQIGYTYPGNYAALTPPAVGGSEGNTYDSEFGHFSLFGTPVTVSGTATSGQTTLWYNWSGMLGGLSQGPQSDALGGWSLSVHHFYDPDGQTLYFGDGHKRTIDTLPPLITTIAGQPNAPAGFAGDGGPASQSILNLPSAVAIGADGTIYVLDARNARVRAITPDGTINTIATTTTTTEASGALAVGPDGSIYIADILGVRRLDPSGAVTTVAGACTSRSTTVEGSGVPAASACLGGLVSSVAVSPDGTVYLMVLTGGVVSGVLLYEVSTDGYLWLILASPSTPTIQPALDGTALASAYLLGAGFNAAGSHVFVGSDGIVYFNDGNQVRGITPDSALSTIAGNGTLFGGGASADGQPAIQVGVEPDAIAADALGKVYFIDKSLFNGPSIKAVRPDGILQTIAGNGVRTLPEPVTAQLATNTSINVYSNTPDSLAVAPDGTLVIAEAAQDAIRRVIPAITGDPVSGYAVADASGHMVYIFDGSGRHLRTQDALTAATIYAFAYDSAGRLSSVKDINGDVTTIVRDGVGNPTAIVNAFGQQTALTVGSDGRLASIQDATGATYSYAYDDDGLLESTTTPRGGLYTYTYDAQGRLLQDVDPAGGGADYSNSDTSAGNAVTLTSAAEVVSRYELDSLASGDIQQVVTRPDGLTTTVRRGANGTNTQTDPDGTVTTWTLSADPRFGMQSPTASSTTVTTPAGITGTRAMTTVVTLSDPTNLLSVQAATTTQTLNGNTWTRLFNARSLVWTTTSPMGRQIATTTDAAGRPVQLTVPSVAPVSMTYDSHGRLTSTTQALGVWTGSYDASGYLASTTDALGHVISFANDPVGRPTQTTLADGRSLGTSYDADSNATTVTLPSTQAHDFSYTPVDLLASYSPPTISSASPGTLYFYDVDERLTSIMRPDGIAVTYGYDAAGRLQSTTIPQGTLTQAYDPKTGHLATVSSPSGETTAFSYDGFLRTGVVWSGPVAGSLSLGFDGNFRMTSQAINGTALPFAYDADGLLTMAGSLTLTLDPQNGRLTGTVLGAVTDAYSYDGNGLFATYVASYNGTTVYSESVLRDFVGRITQKTEVIGSVTHVWGYTFDASGRLTDVSEDGQFASHYGYDADDNRTTFTNPNGTVNPTYDAQDRLSTYGSATYGYTANGELASKTNGSGTTRYTYDALGNLLNVNLPSSTALAYIMDGENRRVGKEIGGTLNGGFLYQDGLDVVAQLDGSGNVLARYVFGSKANVPDYFTNSSETFRILSDHLGSPRLVVNASSGAIVEDIDYDEFGNVTNDTSPGLTPFGFAGGLYDRDTGLVRFGVRDYDASVGRWMSKDPIQFEGGFNLYAYVGNDPINGIDPWGLLILPPDPSGLGPDWAPDPTHRDPTGSRWRHPSGACLDFHPGTPGAPGWGGQDHWHNCGEKKHRKPGSEVPDPAPVCQDPNQSPAPSDDPEPSPSDPRSGGDPIPILPMPFPAPFGPLPSFGFSPGWVPVF